MKLNIFLNQLLNGCFPGSILKKSIFIFFVAFCQIAYSQCPATITATFQVTDATCPQNGIIKVNTNIPTGTSVTYTLTQINPDNTQEPPQNQINDPVFDNLEPSRYRMEITCGSETGVFFVNVGGNYTPISDIAATVTNLCASPTQNGTININSVTGGNPPYKIAVIKSNDPNFTDDDALYTVTNVTTFPASVNVNAGFGTYQIRVKDNCGFSFTISRDVLKAAPAPNNLNFNVSRGTTCTPISATINNFTVTDVSGNSVPVSSYPSPGLHVQMWEQTVSCPTAAPTGTPIFDEYITQTNNSFTLPVVASKKYVILLTSPCGDTKVICKDLTTNLTPDFSIIALNRGCGAAEKMSIRGVSNNFVVFPVTVRVYSGSTATGTPVYTTSPPTANAGALNSWSTGYILDFGTYTVSYTDYCGTVLTKTITLDKPVDPANTPINANVTYLRSICTVPSLIIDQTGTTQVRIEFTNYIENLANATVKIINGPNNVGQVGVFQNFRYFSFNELTPGGTYTVEISSSGTGCASSARTYTFTIPASTTGLLQSLTSVGNSTCSGTGSVTSTIVYNGGYTREVELIDSNGNIIATNTTGTFANIPGGNYTTRLKITPACDTSKTYYISGSQVSIATNTTGPRVTGKAGIICEDANGNPLSSGTAYLTLIGGIPRILEYREQGAATWTLYSNSAPENVVVTGLTPNKVYEFKLTSCGKTFITTLRIKVMRNIRVENTRNPCYNQSYTLVGPSFSGVTYEWRKQGSATVLATTKNYYFPNYTAADDGTYTLTVKWSACVTRVATTVLNGSLCGDPLNVCYRDPRSDGQILDTKHGITAFGRAGAENSNWPMIRKGGHTALEASTKGFVINRLTAAQISAIPFTNLIEGMMVYDITNDCLKIYNGNEWKCFTDQTCPE